MHTKWINYTEQTKLGPARLTHQHIFTKQDPENSTTCNYHLTVQHLLTECRTFANTRIGFKIPTLLEQALKDEKIRIENLIAYLKQINI